MLHVPKVPLVSFALPSPSPYLALVAILLTVHVANTVLVSAAVVILISAHCVVSADYFICSSNPLAHTVDLFVVLITLFVIFDADSDIPPARTTPVYRTVHILR